MVYSHAYTRLLHAVFHSFLDKRKIENADSIASGSRFTETYHTYEEVKIIDTPNLVSHLTSTWLSSKVYHTIIADYRLLKSIGQQ